MHRRYEFVRVIRPHDKVVRVPMIALQRSSEYQYLRVPVISVSGTLGTREDSVVSAFSTLGTREDSVI